MNELWQNVAALGIVALAGGYLLRQGWRLFVAKPANSCGGCTGCSARASDFRRLVSLELSHSKEPS